MLVCSISQRARRAALTADIVEAAAAADALDFANFDMALAEAATAASIVDAGFLITGDIAETASAADVQDGSVPAVVTYTTWNPSDLSSVNLTNGNLTATGTAAGGTRAIKSATSGKFYFECTMTAWSGSGNTGIGIALATANLSTMGSSAASAALAFRSGNIWINGSFSGGSFGSGANGDGIGIAVDLTAKLIWFRKLPSGLWNNSGTANPATGAGGLSISGLSGSLFPAFSAGTSGEATTANFGSSAFSGAVPSGFTAGWPA